MPTVTVIERLHTPLDKVWALICDVRGYPRLMRSVREITVREEAVDDAGITSAVTEWEIELKGSILRWTEREHRDPLRHRITYEQLDGDMERFEGWWQVTEVDIDVTQVELVVDFEIGIPLLKPMLEPVAVRAIERNSTEMLLSLGPRAEH